MKTASFLCINFDLLAMETRLQFIDFAKLISKQWEFMKLSASFLSIAVIAVLMPLMSVIFAGNIDQAHLDGVGLATTMFNVVVTSMSTGYSSVFDTYGPQVYGSSQRSELGTVLLKCLLQGALVNLVILGPYLNLVYVIDLLPDSVTDSDAEGFRDIAVQYLRLILMVEFLDYTVLMLSKYFAIQGHSRFVYVISVIMIGSYLLANYVLVKVLELGVNGLGLAAIIGRIIALLVSITICIVKIRTKEFVWTGFGFKALLGWKPMLKLGVSGALNCFAELSLYEISTFCSQFDGAASFSVVIITTQLLNFCWAFNEGISRAGATLIGSALGDGSADNVRLFILLTVVNTLLECVPLAITCFFLRTYLVQVFNPAEDVVELFVDTFWLACINMVIYHFQNGLNQGVLVAFGEQKFIAWTMSIACYGVGLPVVILLIFFTDLKVLGIIASWMISDLIIITAALFKISKIDISKEIERTRLRVTTNSLKEADEGATIGNPAYHEGATISNPAYHEGATIGNPAYHEGATIGNPAYHEGATISTPAYHEGATISNPAYHEGATISTPAYHEGATISTPAYHEGATIGNPDYHVEDQNLPIIDSERERSQDIEDGTGTGITDGVELAGKHKSNILGFNQEVKNVLTAFLISAILCVILAGISLLRH